MELILASIAAAGLVGASNQYMFILLLGVASRIGWVTLSPEMGFMGSTGFLIGAGLLWVISVAPAYTSHLSPGLANFVNTLGNFVHGFIVPVSAAMVALAASGIITNMHPELSALLQGVSAFNPETSRLSLPGLAIAGGGAVVATGLTGARAAAKPGINVASGTIGHVSAPIWATVETIAAGLLVALFTYLVSVSPWLVVVMAALLALLILVVMLYSFYLLWKFGKGVGRVLRLVDQQPKAGWAIVLEFLSWGGGSVIWKYTGRATLRLLAWAVWMLALLFIGIPALAIPFIGLAIFFFLFIGGGYLGARSAASLLKTLEKDGHILPLRDLQPEPEGRPIPSPA